jgi:hypothetical protein
MIDTKKTSTATEEPTEPWKPASVLVATKLEGKRSRWVRKDQLEKRIAEGWTPREAKDTTPKTILDGSQQGSYVTKRNLILCDMPEAKAKGRDAYYKRLTDGAIGESVQELKRKTHGETYGKIEVTQGEGG